MLLAVLLAAAFAQADSGGVTLPCEVPFECVSDVRMANATASWKMSFDRRYAGVYDIVHWRVVVDGVKPVEYIAQLMRPTEGRMYYRFFVRERRGVWYTLGIRKKSVWREVVRPSTEQDGMAARLRQLFSIAQALRQGADPVSVRF